MPERTETVGDHHDWHDAGYVDRWIAQDATDDERRRPRLRQAAELLPVPRDRAVTVLDVGGGYGEFTAAVLDVLPRATVVLHDYSEPMLDRARARLEPYQDRVEYRRADLLDPTWTDVVGGPFDAVVSALAIHNLGEPDAIRAAYTGIARVLRPGGWFFDLDLVLDVMLSPPDSPLAGLYRAAGGMGHGDGHDHSDGDGDASSHGHGHGHDTSGPPAPGPGEHLEWLRAAGFEYADCVRKDLAEVFLAARTPEH